MYGRRKDDNNNHVGRVDGKKWAEMMMEREVDYRVREEIEGGD